jgi:hypothetical protein
MKKQIAPVLAASALLLAGCSTTHPTRWEYIKATSMTTDWINQKAKEGWTVAGFSEYDAGGVACTAYLLKRPAK